MSTYIRGCVESNIKTTCSNFRRLERVEDRYSGCQGFLVDFNFTYFQPTTNEISTREIFTNYKWNSIYLFMYFYASILILRIRRKISENVFRVTKTALCFVTLGSWLTNLAINKRVFFVTHVTLLFASPAPPTPVPRASITCSVQLSYDAI